MGVPCEFHDSPDASAEGRSLPSDSRVRSTHDRRTMSEHPNVTVINRMTKAVFENDRDTLSALFTDDMTFHMRGPLPRPGDHEASTASSVPSAPSSS